MTFQQNLDKLWRIYICFLDTRNRLENAWRNQFGSWYQSSNCLENNLIWKDELGPGYGGFLSIPQEWPRKHSDKSSIVFFSALIYPYLSRKWSDTFTYKIMMDLFDFPQEM